MKTKSILTGLLSGILCMSVMTACSGSESSVSSSKESSSESSTQTSEESKTESNYTSEDEKDNIHTVYFRLGKTDAKLSAALINSTADTTTEAELTKVSEDGNYVTYSCEGDISLYNMVHVTIGDKVCKDVAFNKYVSGWYFSDETYNYILPYVQGKEPVYNPAYETKVVQFNDMNKNVYIWVPKDYDADSEEKYSTIYALDGQSVLTIGKKKGMDNDSECWNIAESVESMMALSDNKSIIVAIETVDPFRDDELIPDLGEIDDEKLRSEEPKKLGKELADFICSDIMTYVQQNYNVYTDAKHNSLIGSSYAGLETFCAVMDHPDKFGTAGIFSPAFWVYDEKIWEEYLSDKTSMENSPFLYFYAGKYIGDNGNCAYMVYNKLLEMNYPKDRIVYDKYEPGEHYISFWRAIFPEFLEAAFTNKVSAIENGAAVEYKDQTDPEEEFKVIPVDENDPGLLDKNNFVYYDNSETKWENVYVYWWGGKMTNKISGGYYYNEWPGFQMEKIGDTDIYRIVAPEGATGIIFDSGITDKEVAEGVIAYQTVDLHYDSGTCCGKVFKIDTSVPAEEGDIPREKTKFRYPEGSWSDYNG